VNIYAETWLVLCNGKERVDSLARICGATNWTMARICKTLARICGGLARICGEVGFSPWGGSDGACSGRVRGQWKELGKKEADAN